MTATTPSQPEGGPSPAAATRPASKLAGPEGHPVHPILVTIPIGAWISSLLFDLASLVSDYPEAWGHGALWLIGIGLAGALLAACFGVLDLLTIPRGSPAWRTGLTHLGLNTVVIVLLAVGFAWRWSERPFVGETSIGQLVISIVALALLGASGYLGGKLTYTAGVRVAAAATQADELTPAPSTGEDASTGGDPSTGEDASSDD